MTGAASRHILGTMIDLHFWPTPNGHKITIFLEETGTPYRIVPVNIRRGAQFAPEFLAIAPNNKMPAIVDAETGITVFESGAILQYLAEKTRKLLPVEPRARYSALEWLTWQVASVGPALGQLGHFKNYASEKIPYAIDRFVNEAHRLYGVLEKRLDGRDYLAGDYSIADIATWPWMKMASSYDIDLAEFPRAKAWIDRIATRPAVVKALDVGEEIKKLDDGGMDEEARKHLFGQRARR